jgi:hypothetical protein
MLRRNPQSIRRISIVSTVRDFQSLEGNSAGVTIIGKIQLQSKASARIRRHGNATRNAGLKD